MARPEFYQRKDGKWDWRLVAENGEQQAESLQGYSSKTDAIRGFVRTRRAFADLEATPEIVPEEDTPPE